MYRELGAAGLWAARLGPGAHLRDFPIMGGIVQPEEFDYFHEYIVMEETCKLGSAGVSDSIGGGLGIGLPPVQKFASKELYNKIIPECLSGNKRICLAITDPDAGSDVAGLTCRAVLSPCG